MNLLFVLYYQIANKLVRFRDMATGVSLTCFTDCYDSADAGTKYRLELEAGHVWYKSIFAHTSNSASLGGMLSSLLYQAYITGKHVWATGNVAFRERENGNGVAFAFATVINKNGSKATLLTTTTDYTLSYFVHQCGLEYIYVIDFERALELLRKVGIITKEGLELLRSTQFRSLWLPHILMLHRLGFTIPGEWKSAHEHCESLPEDAIICCDKDNFGNSYFYATAQTTGFKVGYKIKLFLPNRELIIKIVSCLAEAAYGEHCLVVASLGLGRSRCFGLMTKSTPEKTGKWPDHFPELRPGVTVKWQIIEE